MSDGPYIRLKEPKPINRRERIRLLGWINVALCVLLISIGVLLMGALIPRAWYHHRFRPYPPNSCIEPFSSCPLVLISMDGFRHDYVELVRSRYGQTALPNFHRLQSGGVRGMRAIGTYPTLTMPNHESLITGLNTESHGVVGDDFQDVKFPNDAFQMNNQTSLNKSPWLEAWPEPIWVTLHHAGRMVGTILWPLTDAPVRSVLPFVQVSQFALFNDPRSRYPYEKRVSDMLWWLDNLRYSLDLILAYFDEPNRAGHMYGPRSDEVAQRVIELDNVVGQLLSGLEARGLHNRVNIIFISTHGMTEVKGVIDLDKHVKPSWYTHTQLSTVGFIYPKSGRFAEVYHGLQQSKEHMKVYRSDDVPPDLCFSRNSSRMPPIVVIPDQGWCLVNNNKTHCDAGEHGYPVNVSDMHGFFYAWGPSFLSNATAEQVHAIDVYPLIAGLLGIQPRPNNGSLERIARAILKSDVAERLITTPTWFPRWWAWFMGQLSMAWLSVGFILWVVLFALLLTSIYVQGRYIRVAAIPDPGRWSEEKN